MDTVIQWLGQAGFLILTSNGKKIAIDPYLSDSCNALVGFKRMVPAPSARWQMRICLKSTPSEEHSMQ